MVTIVVTKARKRANVNFVDTWTFVTRFETNLTYLNLTKPNLIDAPDLPTLVNGFETNLTYLNLT